MKAGWIAKRLGELADFKPPKREARERISGTEEVTFLPMEDLGIAVMYPIARQVKRLDEVVGSYTYFADGDLLLAKITPCFENGKLGVARGLRNGIGFGSSEFIVIRPRESVSSEWLFYFFSQDRFREDGARRMSGAVGQQRLPRDFVEQYEIPVPPLAEQRRIVALLDAAFEGIATAAANAERNLQNARDLFESHLAEVFSRRGEGWVERRLEEVCVLVNGRAYKKPEMLQSGKYPLLRVGNFFTNRDWYYSDLELDADKYCDRGDLLYAWSASFGPRIWDGGKSIYHYHIWKVLPRIEVVQLKFLFYLLQWDVEQIKQAQGTGTTMLHVSKGSMEARVVPIPPLAVQLRLAENLDNLFSEGQRLIAIYEQKQAALASLKRSLLHQAFNGEI